MNDSRPPQSISDKTTVKLSVGIWLVVIFFVFGAGGVFAVMQSQMSSQDRRIEKLESDRELLLRIDERTGEIKRQLERLTK